jgi:TolB-like protein/tRNA A-37 threonylcarbamoyl transferase component Bud32/Tfp pilus assembly protein PilF
MGVDRIRWATTRAIFEDALAANPVERAAVVEARCGDDAQLRREVEALLNGHARAGGFLESSAISLESTAGPDPPSLMRHSIWAGRRVGAYRIIREIGRGGMGYVFLAERADALFEKQVAIKIVRLTADADVLIERFRRERQILATLEHPNITRMLDAGVTDDQVPFVVMEYVDGVPIDEYCDRHQLDVRARLELFCEVCLAAHAAHARGIIHRDLKPANILVTAEGVPKLLDFGIAKLLESASEDARITQTSQRVLTPLTAAPEQLSGGATTVATDIYALGVLLYRLITGDYPFGDAARSSSALEHAIQHTPPPLPSHAVRSRAGVSSLSPAGARDLDYIVLKALKKAPQNRYGSAEDLVADVRQHLDGQLARAPSARLDRARAFAMVHARSIAVTSAVIVLAAAALAWQARQPTVAVNAPPVDTIHSVAIQPFRELDPVDGESRLGWGMADALLTRLASVDSLRVRVIGPGARPPVREASPTATATASPTVDFTIDGTIQRANGRVRVTARLLDAGGAVVWNTTSEDEPSRLFALQDRLSVDITRRLSPRFDVRGLRARSATANERAYEAYVQGRYHLSVNGPEPVRRALHYFEQAASEDPAFAAAHAGIAVTYAWLIEMSPLSPPNQLERGEAAARRALALEDLGEAHAALGMFILIREWNWPRAEEQLKRALALSPSDNMAALWYAASLTAHRRFGEALEHLRRARARDPFDRPLQNQLVRVLYMARQFGEALQECERMATEDPAFAMWPCALSRVQLGDVERGVTELETIVRASPRAPNLAALGYAYGRAGRVADARTIIDTIARLPQPEAGVAYYAAEVSAGLGDREATLSGLERAREERYPLVLMRGLVDAKFDLLTPAERARLVTPPPE